MKKKVFLYMFISLSILLDFLQATAQQNNIDSLFTKFNQYRQQHYQEKVYIHFDRPSYLTGETMWFKIYLTDGCFHKPSGVSKVVYVEFIDGNNQSVLQTKVKVSAGSGSGSLYIPATLISGNYMVRAYTSWMKNFEAGFFFHQPVSIINPFKSVDLKISEFTAYDAQFFPEGGNLVEGIRSKVAFRVADASGVGIDFIGTLLDQNQSVITTFSPLRFGIGHFSFTPQANHHYSAVLRDRAGKTQTIKLPLAQPLGYVIHIADTANNHLQIKVNARVDGASAVQGVYLFVHARNIIASASFQILNESSASFHINKSDLPEGISHITVFDVSMKPVCERLYFKQPGTILTLTARVDQTQYGLRSPVKIDLTAMVDHVAKESNASVSVFKVDSLHLLDVNGDIVNYFWLTSDLRGTVESPEFYFMKTSEAREAADNLMLTHGWRRFIWSDVLSDKKSKPHFVPELSGHIIQGVVTNEDGSAARNVVAYLSSPAKVVRLYASRSNNKGEVHFGTDGIFANSKIIAQTNHKKDSTYKISIKSPFSDQFAMPRMPAFSLSPTGESSLLNRSFSMQVQDIYFSGDKMKMTHTDCSGFYGLADEEYMLDDFTRFQVMEEVMREYVAQAERWISFQGA